MPAVSNATKRRILEQWFQGRPRDVIARKEHLSGSTVSSITSVVPESIEPLRQLSVELRKLKLSPSDALRGTKLLATLEKLGIQSAELTRSLRVVRALAKKNGVDVPVLMQNARELRRLEDDSGKPYGQARAEYQNFLKKSENLNGKTRRQRQELQHLKRACQTLRDERQNLQEECVNVHQQLDQLRATRDELCASDLCPDDYDTVNNFLAEVDRLGGSAKSVVRAVKECGSLEAKNQQEYERLVTVTEARKVEEQRLAAARAENATLEESIQNNQEQHKRDRKRFEQDAARWTTTIGNLQARAQAEGQRVDGVLKTQAQQLKVQPDIDVVAKALPQQQAELERKEQRIVDLDREYERMYAEKRVPLERAAALAAFWQKKPYRRDDLLTLLNQGLGRKDFSLPDELAHRRMVEMMAEHGFVPKKRLQDADLTIEVLRRTVENRERELAECHQRRKREVAAKQRTIDQITDRRAASLIAEVAKRVQE